MAAGLVTQGSKIAKKQSFTAAVTAYRNGFVIMPVRHNDAKESKSSMAKLPSAIAWISEHAKPGEGHTQQVATDDSMHFQGESRKQLWRRMNGDLGERLVQRGQKVAMREGKPEVCSYQWFLRAVITLNKTARTEDYPELAHVVFDRWCTHAECGACTALKVMRQRCIANGDVQQRQWVEGLLERHKVIARLERLTYHQRIERASIRKKTWGFAVDGYCVRKSAGMMMNGHPMHELKGIPGMHDAEILKFKTTGVLVHGFGYYMYIASPTLSGNANFNLHCIYSTLLYMFEVLHDPNDDRITSFPDELYIQIDGASDNRASVFFMLCEWLVRLGLFDVIKVAFLIVGHTHNDADQQFVPITFHLRRALIKTIHDLKAAYFASYAADKKPHRIDIVEAVPDFTHWLVESVGLPFGGMSRHGPDENRPHCYEFYSTGTGGCKMNYKNLCVDKAEWNKDSVQLLSEMPDPAGPRMQAPIRAHIAKVADIKARVLTNFKLNDTAPGTFTDEDKAYVYDLFDSFCDDAEEGVVLQLGRLREHMLKVYVWKKPPKPYYRAEPDVAVPEHKRPVVEPITHSKFTDAQRRRALKEAQAEIEREREDEAQVEQDSGKALARGSRHMSKKAVAALCRYQKEMDAALKKTQPNAKPVYIASIIIGAANVNNEMYYLCNTANTSDEPILKWLRTDQVDVDSINRLTEHALNSEMVVWWSDGTTAGVETPYRAIIKSQGEDNPKIVKLKYIEDDAVEYLDCQTLAVEAFHEDETSPASEENVGTRTMWMLQQHKGKVLNPSAFAAQFRVNRGIPQSTQSGQTKQKRKEVSKKRQRAVVATSESDADEDEDEDEDEESAGIDREEPIENASAPPLDLEQNRRPKRAHAKPDRFDFRRDGLNDTALKKKSTSKK